MRNEGISGREITRGTKINGRSVVAMKRGVRDHKEVVIVQFAEVDRKGRKRLSEPVPYWLNGRVPGTATPTTWAMPAGPVHRKPGTEPNGGWYGDGGGTPADRHQRRIEAITYA
jgi:hypothetical protein